MISAGIKVNQICGGRGGIWNDLFLVLLIYFSAHPDKQTAKLKEKLIHRKQNY